MFILTIAGSDCSGGAGIQADIQTICAHKLYPETVITAITSQHPTKFYKIQAVASEMIRSQLQAIEEYHLPQAIKIGMIYNIASSKIIVEFLNRHPHIPVVIDPLILSSSGTELITKATLEYNCKYLFPLATLMTPNQAEACYLSHSTISDLPSQIRAGHILHKQLGCNILVKGGHNLDNATDILITSEGHRLFPGSKIAKATSKRGTGCTLSSAIACHLALGHTLDKAILKAKEYITHALASSSEHPELLNHWPK